MENAVAQEGTDEENELPDHLKTVIEPKSKKRRSSQTRRSSAGSSRKKKASKDTDSTANASITDLLAVIDRKIGEIVPKVNTIQEEMKPQNPTKFEEMRELLEEIFQINST